MKNHSSRGYFLHALYLPCYFLSVLKLEKNYLCSDYMVNSGSRDKLTCNETKHCKDWRHERFRDIATALSERSAESNLTLPAEISANLKKVRVIFFMQENKLKIIIFCKVIKIKFVPKIYILSQISLVKLIQVHIIYSSSIIFVSG